MIFVFYKMSLKCQRKYQVDMSNRRVFKIFLLFFNLFLAVLGLHCCTWAFSSCGEWGLLFIVVHGLLMVVTSLPAEHRL